MTLELNGMKLKPMTLTKTQTKALDSLEGNAISEVLFGGGAGGGKSAVGCYWILKSALKYPGTRWVIGRSVLKVLKETTLNTFWDITTMQGIQTKVHFDYNPNQGIIKIINGSEIILKDLFLYPSDPQFDSLGSLEITGAFVDECNQISEKAWNILKSRIRYKLDEHNLIPTILGTCNPAKNWVYNRFYTPTVSGEIDPSKIFIQSLLSDNPNISVHYKRNLESLDENSKQRLLHGNWEYDDDPNSLLDFDAIKDLWTNTGVKEGEGAITADIAMQGSDKLIITIWKGFRVVKIVAVEKSGGKDVETLIKSLAEQYNVRRSKIVFDSDGVGDYLGQYLNNARPFKNGSKPVGRTNYANLKTQCGYLLAKRITQGGIYIVDDEYQEEITRELEQLKSYKTDDDGKLRILPKKEIKKNIGHSPDYMDTLIMREFLELTKSTVSWGVA